MVISYEKGKNCIPEYKKKCHCHFTQLSFRKKVLKLSRRTYSPGERIINGGGDSISIFHLTSCNLITTNLSGHIFYKHAYILPFDLRKKVVSRDSATAEERATAI